MSRKPILVTLGDPNGVGPRLVAKTLLRNANSKAHLVAVGDPAVLNAALFAEGSDLSAKIWQPGQALSKGLWILAPDSLPKGAIEPGCTTAWAGEQALAAVNTATDLCKAGLAGAMVTAPLSKESVSLVLPGFSGHTGHIAARCGVRSHCLCLVHKNLWAAFVTTHIALRDVSEACTPEAIFDTAQLLDAALRKTGLGNPRIGVAGLNPHAGEHGLFGNEEVTAIEPAVRRMQSEGINATGPWPADVVFPMMHGGRLDGVVSLYHDQGHVVMKTLAFDFRLNRLRGVNVTLGLPIVRTSPDHGTAFDIAWKSEAHDGSLRDAIALAKRMVGSE